MSLDPNLEKYPLLFKAIFCIILWLFFWNFEQFTSVPQSTLTITDPSWPCQFSKFILWSYAKLIFALIHASRRRDGYNYLIFIPKSRRHNRVLVYNSRLCKSINCLYLIYICYFSEVAHERRPQHISRDVHAAHVTCMWRACDVLTDKCYHSRNCQIEVLN